MAINKRLIAGAPTGGGGACTTNTLQILGDSSCIAYYKMADATDESGSFNGTASNVNFNVEGQYGLAGGFNGSSSSIVVPNDILSSNFSISCWFKIDNTSGDQVLFEFDHENRVLFRVASTDNNKAFIGNSGYFNHGLTFSANQWYHFVLTFSNGNPFKIYVNNSLSFTGSNTSVNAFNNDNIIGAGNSSGSGAVDGKIDQFRIFNKELSASEVGTLYAEVQCASAVTPSAAFNSVLYTGNGGTQPINTVGFQPDFVWNKVRSVSGDHNLTDSVRGAQKGLNSNLSSAEGNQSPLGITFLSNGFTAIDNSGGGASVNGSGKTYVAWNWYAPTSETNNAGSNGATIASTIKKNVDAGFSIVKYTAAGSKSIYHGLSQAPEIIIQKRTDVTSEWITYTAATGLQNYLQLQDLESIRTDANFMTAVGASTFTSQWSSNSHDYINYCFHSVEGYSRIGSYKGNNSTNGPVVVTGFEPAFVMIKRTDSTANWRILDNKRSPSNPRSKELYPNLINAEGDFDAIDFFSNGFQNISTDASYNANNGSYIFMAFAQDPDTTPATKADSFEAKTYTGNGTSQEIDLSNGMKPDMVWIKSRNEAGHHGLFDSIRGKNQYLTPNQTGAEIDRTSNNAGLTSFDSDGFSVNDPGGSGENYYVNQQNVTYISWNWKAADHDRSLATINQDGSITSLVSANVAGGFSIVKYTGDGGSSKTIGHGLTTQPNLVIFKRTDASVNWFVFFRPASGNTIGLEGLNTSSGAFSTNYTTFQPSTTTMTTSGSTSDFNGSGNSYIMYNFVNVAGYQKIGSYIGTGNAGLVEQVGFTPSFLLVKRTDAAGGIAKGWFLLDNKRNTSNPRNTSLEAQGAFADNTLSSISFDFDATSFKINGTNRQVNEANGNYIYLAIA